MMKVCSGHGVECDVCKNGDAGTVAIKRWEALKRPGLGK